MTFLSLLYSFEAFLFLNLVIFWGNVCLSKCNSSGTTEHIFMTYAIKPPNAHVVHICCICTTYFIDVHLLVLLHKSEHSFNTWLWNILRYS